MKRVSDKDCIRIKHVKTVEDRNRQWGSTGSMAAICPYCEKHTEIGEIGSEDLTKVCEFCDGEFIVEKSSPLRTLAERFKDET